MNYFESIILGLIQGLTEFLPVSSSGHLELAKGILGEGKVPAEGLLMTLTLHLATALSTIVIFRKDILSIIKSFFTFKRDEDFYFALKVILSMIPATIIGFFLEDQIDALFGGQFALVGAMLILTAILLYFADKAKKTEKGVSFSSALIIGLSQGIAILPGISRSGATISTSVLLGVDRSKAAKFSFIMVIPLIFGAMLLKGLQYYKTASLDKDTIENRTKSILTHVREDVNLTTTQAASLSTLILSQENSWEKLSTKREDFDTFKKQYVSSLEKTFGKALGETISKDKYLIRSKAHIGLGVLLAGFIAAFLTGLLACQWMIALVKKSNLKYFSYYCMIAGLGAIIFYYTK